jgi:predicted amidohydrolase
MKTPPTEGGTPLRLAMCQVLTKAWDMEGNLGRTLDALREAAAQGAELAITPECVLHGYGDARTDEEKARLLREGAVRLDSAPVAAIRAVARETGMAIVAGFAELADGGLVHNTAAFIRPDGEIAHVYRKVHCRPFESADHDGAFTPGTEFHAEALRTARGAFRVGTMICFDREIPESVRCLRALGSQLVACPLATNTDRLDAFHDHAENEMLTRIRAAENELFIAVVNHAGTFNGGSFIVGPGGECGAQMGDAPGVLVLDLPVGAVPERYHSEPLGWLGWGYRRPDVYARYLPGGA